MTKTYMIWDIPNNELYEGNPLMCIADVYSHFKLTDKDVAVKMLDDATEDNPIRIDYLEYWTE